MRIQFEIECVLKKKTVMKYSVKFGQHKYLLMQLFVIYLFWQIYSMLFYLADLRQEHFVDFARGTVAI